MQVHLKGAGGGWFPLPGELWETLGKRRGNNWASYERMVIQAGTVLAACVKGQRIKDKFTVSVLAVWEKDMALTLLAHERSNDARPG